MSRLSSILVKTEKAEAIPAIITSESQTRDTSSNGKTKQFTVTSNNGKTTTFIVTEKTVGGKHKLQNKMRLKYRMGVRRTVKKSRTAKRRQNGGVIFVGAPVNYSVPPNQRQPTEAIMERATTAGGKRKGSYRKRRGTRRNKRN